MSSDSRTTLSQRQLMLANNPATRLHDWLRRFQEAATDTSTVVEVWASVFGTTTALLTLQRLALILEQFDKLTLQVAISEALRNGPYANNLGEIQQFLHDLHLARDAKEAIRAISPVTWYNLEVVADVLRKSDPESSIAISEYNGLLEQAVLCRQSDVTVSQEIDEVSDVHMMISEATFQLLDAVKRIEFEGLCALWSVWVEVQGELFVVGEVENFAAVMMSKENAPHHAFFVECRRLAELWVQRPAPFTEHVELDRLSAAGPCVR
jgi:hypothetical protein